MSGGMDGWFRLRVGELSRNPASDGYRNDEVLYVDAIGPRGDIYNA